MSEYTDRVFAVLADLHGGHLLGLMRNGTLVPRERIVTMVDPLSGLSHRVMETYDERLYQNALQIFLADAYTEDLIWLHNLARGRPIDIRVNGDVTQGQKYVREWVTTRMSDQLHIAKHFLRMPLELPTIDSFGFIAGTGSHEFEEATSPILLRDMLQQYAPFPITFQQHSLVHVNQAVFDIAHHGPAPGSRRWLEGNSLRWYVNDIQQRELDLGRTPPDWVVRSHYHTVAKATSDYRRATKMYTTNAVLTPGYTGMDAFARQAVRSKYEVHVGMLAWEVDANGNTQLRPKFRIIDTRAREVIA